MKISVIVPVYNVENYLDKCLNSLVNQTLKDIEIIVVNDGAKDNSQKIIDEYAGKYNNIKSYIKENGGLSSARNYGLKMATSDFIAFVDSDDYVDYTMYEKMYNKMISDDFDIVVCDLYMKYPNKQIYTSSNIKNDLMNKAEIKDAILNIYPVAWNKLYKKDLFKDLHFKEKVWFEDVEILHRMFPRFNKIGVVKDPLYYYVQRDGAITSKVNLKIYDYIDNFNGIIEYHKKNNTYNEYKDVLEYCYVRYIYATFMKRVLELDYNEYKKALDFAVKSVSKNFKNYKRNILFYKSFKGLYLIAFNKFNAILLYKIKHLFFK